MIRSNRKVVEGPERDACGVRLPFAVTAKVAPPGSRLRRRRTIKLRDVSLRGKQDGLQGKESQARMPTAPGRNQIDETLPACERKKKGEASLWKVGLA